MTIIEGIGDEVTYFFIGAIVIIIATIAWLTTDIQQGLYVRTVYLIEHSRNQTRLTTLTNHTESATITEGSPIEGDPDIPDTGNNDDADESGSEEVIELLEDGAVEIIEAMDAPDNDSETVSLLRQRRLQHFTSNSNDGRANNEVTTDTREQTIDSTLPQAQTSSNITIKLKYINDDLKIVDGRLEEQLGDFKRRHFNVELEANKLVRLIFNGQVLQQDSETLESYGMFNNCVVHCLVHQPRPTSPGDSGQLLNSGNRGSGNSQSSTTHRDWDLGNLLIASLSFTLGSAWYFRYQYPQLFTISTTVGLIALTGMFSVISMSMYFPDFVTRIQPNHPPPENSTTNRT